MKIILIQPRYKSHMLHPPLGLGYIASVLKKEGHRVDLIDANLGISINEIIERIKDIKPGLIGISVMTSVFEETKNIVKIIKKETDTPIVLGGVHITALPKFSIEKTGADFCVYGESELTIKELVFALDDRKSLDEIKGLVYRKRNKIVINPPRELIEDLNSLPFPEWSLMDPKKYYIAPVLASAEDFPTAPIMTTRGCPFQCTYCASNVTWRRRLRFRSPENIADEIEYLIDNFGVKYIHFSDDNFTFSKKHTVGVCNEILKRGIKIKWGCPNGVRVDSLDDEILMLMRKAGCNMIGFGIESGSQEILNNINKRLDLSIVPRIIKNAKKYNITTFGFFILGLPGETKKTIKKTIDFAKKLELNRAWFFILAPLPGSKIFDEWSQDRELTDIPWNCLDTYTGIICTPYITEGDLQKYQKIALREFYMRPLIILNLLKKTRFRNIKTLVKWTLVRIKNIKN